MTLLAASEVAEPTALLQVTQVIDFIVSRVLDHLGVENTLMQRYGEPARRRHPEED